MGLLLLMVGSCAAPPVTTPRPAPPIAQDDRHLVAVLVAGDDSIAAFDDATVYLRDQLLAVGVPAEQIHLSSARARPPHGAETANLATILARIAVAKPAPGGSCLVYLASHGTEENGIYLARGNDVLMPEQLDQALTQGCGGAPTVVVASACYAGRFAAPPMLRPNRIILTASADDRTSFGCAAGQSFTVFDECLLGALPDAPDWQDVAHRTEGCVRLREHDLGAEPSEPQSSFGTAVASLGAPWRAAAGSDPTRIRFTPGPGHYAGALVPFGTFQRQQRAAALKAYALAPSPKAMALTPSGLVTLVDGKRNGSANADDVARMALQRCEFLSGGACVLFARDDRMVELLPSGLTPLHPEILVREGDLRPDAVPFIRADQRPLVAQYLTRKTPKALAVSPGHTDLGLGSGATLAAARDAALNQCQADGHRCVIDAEDNQIVLGWGP